jgi:SsrA-binding protein
MAKKKKKKKHPGVRIGNRRAFHDYHISEKVECGMELTGTEAKSLRAGQAKIDEAHARVLDGQLFLLGMNIAKYPMAAEGMQHNPTRRRRLLAHRRQIRELEKRCTQKGKTLIPLAVYFHKGWAKCEIGIAEGKQAHDKRHTLKEKQAKREMDRASSKRRR